MSWLLANIHARTFLSGPPFTTASRAAIASAIVLPAEAHLRALYPLAIPQTPSQIALMYHFAILFSAPPFQGAAVTKATKALTASPSFARSNSVAFAFVISNSDTYFEDSCQPQPFTMLVCWSSFFSIPPIPYVCVYKENPTYQNRHIARLNLNILLLFFLRLIFYAQPFHRFVEGFAVDFFLRAIGRGRSGVVEGRGRGAFVDGGGLGFGHCDWSAVVGVRMC